MITSKIVVWVLISFNGSGYNTINVVDKFKTEQACNVYKQEIIKIGKEQNIFLPASIRSDYPLHCIKRNIE